MFLLISPIYPASAQNGGSAWRVATEGELQALLPARATVEKEHIETEMRTASGVTDGHGKFIVGVVLITAGYSADGKYSHFLVSHVPFQFGDIALPPGEYVFGWERKDDFLNVHLYDAATGALRGSVDARRIPNITRVESFRIWPPRAMSVIQIGRFGIQYKIQK